MNKAKYRIQYSQRTALTLIELIVAVGLMVMIIAGIGYVFSSTSKTVSAARNASEINCTIRATTLQISDDFRMLDKDGFLAIVGATANTPPILMFTATGLFEPIRIPPGSAWTNSQMNADKTTNSAVIMYTLARVPYIPTSTPDSSKPAQLALVRYVYRLAGSSTYFNSGSDEPVFIGNLIMWYRANISDVNTASEAMACGDFMFASLPNIQELPVDPSASDDLFEEMLYPFLYAFAASSPMGWPEIDVDPADLEGVEQLWPYLIGGLPDSPDAMKVDFYDGDDADCANWTADHSDGDSYKSKQGLTPPNDVSITDDYWMDITSVMGDLRSSYRNEPVTNKCIADTITVNGVDYPVAIWSGKNKDVWPQQLRFRMQLTNIANEANTPREYELVLPVR